jgi:hypothetical protein
MILLRTARPPGRVARHGACLTVDPAAMRANHINVE